MPINAMQRKKINLVETLDRALNKGIVVSGEVIISVADVDLVYLQLRLLVSSVETAMEMQNKCKHTVEEASYV